MKKKVGGNRIVWPEPRVRLEEGIRRDAETGCWVWQKSQVGAGYGGISFNGRKTTTHRLSYILFKGPIPVGLEIDHLCRNRLCCNPEHLEAVTRKVNRRRAIPFNLKSVCKRGHPLSGYNLLPRHRNCRICHGVSTLRNKKRRDAEARAKRYDEMSPNYYKPREAADALGVGLGYIYELSSEGELDIMRDKRTIWISKECIHARIINKGMSA